MFLAAPFLLVVAQIAARHDVVHGRQPGRAPSLLDGVVAAPRVAVLPQEIDDILECQDRDAGEPRGICMGVLCGKLKHSPGTLCATVDRGTFVFILLVLRIELVGNF